ncbi:hypothetical protein GCM10009663_71800 [Kitasatospora arboriphila]|uniref:Transposase n=1 Tax=Kitasatospora arboriphila TaxID=258052 RepID=A0ABN1U6D1_9ACTN
MGRPSKYSDEFRRDAVALYRAAEGRRTFASVAKEIGVNHETEVTPGVWTQGFHAVRESLVLRL